MRLRALVSCVTVLTVAGLLPAGEIDGDLATKLQQADPQEVISTLVYLNERVDLGTITQQMDTQQATLAHRHETVVRALQERAQDTQMQLSAHLDQLQSAGHIAEFETFWITNVVRVDAVPDEIVLLADRDDVERVYFNYPN